MPEGLLAAERSRLLSIHRTQDRTRIEHRNQQCSVTALTSSTGSVLERYAYTAYGVPSICNASGTLLTASAHNSRYTYTGREWDNDVKQYHYRARMYDASLGRFCSRDPIGYLRYLNLFLFVRSSPLVYMDPTGFEETKTQVLSVFPKSSPD